MVDSKIHRAGCRGGIQDAPLVLHYAATGRSLRQELGHMCSFATNAKCTDSTLFYQGLQQLPQAVVVQVSCHCLVQQQNVDIASLKSTQTSINR